MRELLWYKVVGKDVVPVYHRDNEDDYNQLTDLTAGSFMKTRMRQCYKNGDGWSKQRVFIVSTCFLSIDHAYIKEGDPVVFETMVFEEIDDKIDFTDLYCRRYTDYDEAVAHHLELVGEINAGRQTFEERSNV